MSNFWTGFDYGRDWCSDFAISGKRQWLVTNGIGGYASGTIAGQQSSRYHGLLIAALQPPLGRTLLVSRIEETASYGGKSWPLYTNQTSPAKIFPLGFQLLERFRLEGTTPVWTFACADAQLEKRVWMQPGENTTYIQYLLLRSSAPFQLDMRILINYRDHHAETRAGDFQPEIQKLDQGVMIMPGEIFEPFYIFSPSVQINVQSEWKPNYFLSIEAERGLPDTEAHLLLGFARAGLQSGDSLTVIATTKTSPILDPYSAYQQRSDYEQSLLRNAGAESAPDWKQRLILAADQFIVKRSLPEEPEGQSVIAGYPWFGDWGRDTMISLPGLTLPTRREEAAKKILLTFARYIDQGMLPNHFPEAGVTPEYNTVDATLWYFEAIRAYYHQTGDKHLLRQLIPRLEDIISWHLRGTRYSIRVSEADGLLYAGEPGVQLTWMDAKVGEWVVTPRVGKPVEVNALWYHALCSTAYFAQELEIPAEQYLTLADQVKTSFQRFWIESQGHCFDVIDGPQGNDSALRPNQLFAVSLPFSPLDALQQRSIVDICARYLLTSHGLRSLAKETKDHELTPGYIGTYAGDRRNRDAAYHQGTVWGWLLGPFASAYFRVYQDREIARSFLIPLIQQLNSHCIGSLSEIFDGDAPFEPRGCIAQAWTVAEALRVCHELDSK